MTTPDISPPAVGWSQDIAGQTVVLAYGDTGAEYDVLRRGAGLVDRRHRGRLRFSGAKAADVVAGLVTNDLSALQPGQGMYAAALTPKGKIIADVRIFAEDGSYLVDTGARAWPGWFAMVQKFVNPRLAKYEDVSGAMQDIGVFGATARHVIESMTGINSTALTALPMYGHVAAQVAGAEVVVARAPDIGIEGFDLFVPAESYDGVWENAASAGAVPVGLGAWEIFRVEAGRPEWGIDMDENTLVQEANLDELGAVSYTKGCYVGQEVVARVHFRGHVNRHLRGLRAASAEPPARTARLFDDAGTDVGQVRSAVTSPRLGGIALAMVRREVAAGTTLLAKLDGDDAGRRVDLVPLPFAV